MDLSFSKQQSRGFQSGLSAPNTQGSNFVAILFPHPSSKGETLRGLFEKVGSKNNLNYDSFIEIGGKSAHSFTFMNYCRRFSCLTFGALLGSSPCSFGGSCLAARLQCRHVAHDSVAVTPGS